MKDSKKISMAVSLLDGPALQRNVNLRQRNERPDLCYTTSAKIDQPAYRFLLFGPFLIEESW